MPKSMRPGNPSHSKRKHTALSKISDRDGVSVSAVKVAVIGTGYVGTVAGAAFAEGGNHVICVDKDSRKVEALSMGDPVIFEPGLGEMLVRNIAAGRIRFTTSIADAVSRSEIIFMTVGTPPLANGDADLSHIERAAREVGRAMTGYRVIVNKSTVPIGTHRKVAEWIREETDHPFDVVSNPEFLREGAAIKDFLLPDRVVIGTNNDLAFAKLKRLYESSTSQTVILRMDPVSAELTKYASNAFLATRISFMNELARLCDRVGANVDLIRTGMGLDRRIGRHFLAAGIGYGGSCFPKDIRALLSTAKTVALELKIVNATEEVNAEQKLALVEPIIARLGKNGRLDGRTFALWGIAFKPDTDDIRDAPALELIQALTLLGARIRAYDPAAMKNARELLGDQIEFCDDPASAANGCDAVILATEWPEFREIELAQVARLLRRKLVFDGRNFLDYRAAHQAGLDYVGIGRGQLWLPGASLDEQNADGKDSDLASRALTA